MFRVRSEWKRFALMTATALVAAAPAAAITHEVLVKNNFFDPADITVAPGDTIRWVWVQGVHTTTSGFPCTPDGIWNAPITSANPVFEYTLPEDGPTFYHYFCIPHCGIGMVGSITVDPDAVHFEIVLDGDQEVPPVDTGASGSGTATLLPATGELFWEITFSGLEGAQTAAHFHGFAPACQNAGVQIGLPTGSPIIGSATLSPTQITNLLLGRWYINVHSSLHPGGEIRGQLMPARIDDPIVETIATGSVAIRLQTVATGLVAPNWGIYAPGDDSRLFVSDQVGTLWAIDLATGDKSVFLDVSSRLVSLGIGGPGTFDERGFLGVAFHPNYQSNGLLYTYTSEPTAGPADFSTMPLGFDPNHQAVILEWQVPDPADPDSVVDPGSVRELLRVDEPQFNHNGGCMQFGPDGMLYVAFGDGGARDDHDGGPPTAGDPVVGHGCLGNGADFGTLLGSIIRIDPLGTDSANGQYGIPGDNPLLDEEDALDEIYAYGFRNPFRFSFDMMTGDFYVGDVGQNDIEEVDMVTAGGNYGWRWKEGSFTFVFNGNQPGYVTDVPLDMPGDLIDPIAEYDHDEGISVIGGFVFHGALFPELEGRYVFGEFAQTFSNDGRLFYLNDANVIREFELIGMDGVGLSIMGFGQDANGEVYVLCNGTGVPFPDGGGNHTGVILRIRSPRGDLNCDGVVNFQDINPFTLALSSPAGYEAAFPDCNRDYADINADGFVGLSDINPFVVLLSTGG